MLGEVGLDKVFRLPMDAGGWDSKSKDPSKVEYENEHAKAEQKSEIKNAHTLARRNHSLSSLTVSMQHQSEVLKRQVEAAIEFKRNVSFHCVRASSGLVEFLKEMKGKSGKGWEEISEYQIVGSCFL